MLTRKILALDISIASHKEILNSIVALAKSKQSAFICFVNAHMSIEAYRNKSLSNLINNAAILAADGVPVAKSIKLLYHIDQERVSGMDCFPELIKAAEANSISIFLFGSTNEVLKRIKKRILSEYPCTNIKGTFSPPFSRSLNEDEYIDMINNSGADMVFVALGCPKQEIWMAKNYRKIHAVLLGVGGAFAVYGGLHPRAPKWMQKYSLEWLYRLVQEPARLWKRYFFTNFLFLLLIFKQWISKLT